MTLTELFNYIKVNDAIWAFNTFGYILCIFFLWNKKGAWFWWSVIVMFSATIYWSSRFFL